MNGFDKVYSTILRLENNSSPDPTKRYFWCSEAFSFIGQDFVFTKNSLVFNHMELFLFDIKLLDFFWVYPLRVTLACWILLWDGDTFLFLPGVIWIFIPSLQAVHNYQLSYYITCNYYGKAKREDFRSPTQPITLAFPPLQLTAISYDTTLTTFTDL